MGEGVEYLGYIVMSRHDCVICDVKVYEAPFESNSLVSSIEEFSVLMPLQCFLFFLGLTLECQLVKKYSLQNDLVIYSVLIKLVTGLYLSFLQS